MRTPFGMQLGSRENGMFGSASPHRLRQSHRRPVPVRLAGTGRWPQPHGGRGAQGFGLHRRHGAAFHPGGFPMKISSEILPGRLLEISEEIRRAGGSIYLVGGWVRDLLMDRPCHDYDLEVYGLDMEKLFNILVKYAKPNLVGKAFGIITMNIEGVDFDFAFPRTDRKSTRLNSSHVKISYAVFCLKKKSA